MSQKLYDQERQFIADTARAIRILTADSIFDHRQYIGPKWLAAKPIHGDYVEVSQGRLIKAIGQVLKPTNVVEIGVGPGITAHSLLTVCPKMQYLAIDNMASGQDLIEETLDNLSERGGNWILQEADSDDLQEFTHPDGPIDLIHVDGDHSFEHQKRDVEKAIRSGAEWLLVDDCNDTEVVTACFAAWKNMWNYPGGWRGGLLPMIYFEDSRTGSFLFHAGMWKYA